MTRHLESCLGKQEAAKRPPGTPTLQRARLFHIVVEGRYERVYWLHLDVRASAKLADLDDFLREIWLECCGHMSAFEIEGRRYSVAPMGEYGERGMRQELGKALRPGMEFFHEYDFGSTTHLTLKVASERDGELRPEPIQLLARNAPPEIPCGTCGKPATQVCTECGYEPEGWLCDGCARDHECDEDMFLPVVNSPRVGVCGYTGPLPPDEAEELLELEPEI